MQWVAPPAYVLWWIFFKCAFKLSFLLNLFPQFSTSHWKGFSLEWLFMWRLTCSGL